MGLAEVLRAHMWTGGYFCSCGHELNSPRGFNEHLMGFVLAHLADVLGSDETREVVAKSCSPFGYQRDGSLPVMYGRSSGEIANAALAAVREVLGLLGGGA